MDRAEHCDLCRRQPIGYTTHEFHWHLCWWHFVSAAGCGFLPVLYGGANPMTPEEAAEERTRA